MSRFQAWSYLRCAQLLSFSLAVLSGVEAVEGSLAVLSGVGDCTTYYDVGLGGGTKAIGELDGAVA